MLWRCQCWLWQYAPSNQCCNVHVTLPPTRGTCGNNNWGWGDTSDMAHRLNLVPLTPTHQLGSTQQSCVLLIDEVSIQIPSGADPGAGGSDGNPPYSWISHCPYYSEGFFFFFFNHLNLLQLQGLFRSSWYVGFLFSGASGTPFPQIQGVFAP